MAIIYLNNEIKKEFDKKKRIGESDSDVICRLLCITDNKKALKSIKPMFVNSSVDVSLSKITKNTISYLKRKYRLAGFDVVVNPIDSQKVKVFCLKYNKYHSSGFKNTQDYI